MLEARLLVRNFEETFEEMWELRRVKDFRTASPMCSSAWAAGA